MSDEPSTSFDLDPELRKQLIAEAEAEDRTISAFIGELLRDHVVKKKQAQEYDAWFDTEIEQALSEADDPSVRRVPDDRVRANLARRMASLEDRS